jgi:PAS domain S-box-containing protein
VATGALDLGRRLRHLARRPGSKLAIFGLSLSVVAVVLFLGDLYSRYRAAIEVAEHNARSFAEVLAEYTARTVETIDRALLEAERIRQDAIAGRFSTDKSIDDALRHVQQASPFLLAIGWTDAAGNLRQCSCDDVIEPPHIADLPHFTSQRDTPNLGLFVSPPFRSPVNGRWIAAVSRRLNNADGSFAGILTAPVDQSYFASVYRSIRPGRHDAVLLLSRQGRVIAREPMVADAIGGSLLDAPLLRQHLPQAEAGSFEALSPIDGRDRIAGYKAVPGLPLVVLVAYDRAEVLQPWYRHLRTFGSLVAVLVAVILLGTLLALRLSGRRQEAEARYRLLADNSSDIIMRYDLEGVRSYISPAVRRLFGYDPTEIVGRRDWLEFIHPEDRPAVTKGLDALRAGADEQTFMYRVQSANGTYIWVESVARLLRDAETGAPREVISIVRDITHRKLAEARADAAREEAERANQAKSDFLAGISHEIRTPITCVLGMADLLVESKLSALQRRHVSLLRDAGQSLLAIIDDLLDISKIEAGKLELERIPLSPSAVVEGAVAIVRSGAAAKGLALGSELAADLPARIEGDPTRLRQVLLNLLSNAIKFTDRGSVVIRAMRAPAAQLRFEVADTGPGIDPTQRHRLFQRFSQVGQSTYRRFGGSGLGLAISQHLVEAMGGMIGVDSAIGAGSTFWFTIPFVETDAPAAVTARAPVVAASGVGARILVAEDQAIIREFIDVMLTSAGHKVVSVTNGAEAVAAVQAQDFDLVLMDVQMPEMDGMTATRRIRGMGDRVRGIPIIALTAYAMPADVARCLAAGASGHLSKPIDRNELLSLVARWSGSDGTVAAAPPPGEPAAPQVIDGTVLDDLERRLGKARVSVLAGQFRRQVTKALDVVAVTTDPRRIAEAMHDLLSVAGILGCMELSTRGRVLMDAAGLQTPDLGPLVAALQSAANQAMAAIADRYPC